MLHGKLLKILKDRGVVAAGGDFQLRDDGAGPYIAAWNTAVLGARPMQSDLDAVTTGEALAAATDRLIALDVDRGLVKAMVLFYLRDKLGRNPTVAERDAARAAFMQAYRDVS